MTDDDLAVVAEVMEDRRKMVERVYVISEFANRKWVRRGLLDEHGSIFCAGDGWSSRHGARILKMPGLVAHHDWYDGWENGANRRLKDWCWAYGMRPGKPPRNPGGLRVREAQIGGVTFTFGY